MYKPYLSVSIYNIDIRKKVGLMNKVKKTILKYLSYPFSNIKRYYKIYRKIIIAMNPYHNYLNNILDYKLKVKGRTIPIRIFLPKNQKENKVLIFFHGGGWVTGNINTYTKICRNMANQTGHTVISVDYRLAPEYPFPSGLLDCYLIAREIFLNPHLFYCNPEDITLIGDSAGGNLAAVVSLMARDLGEFLPSKQILLYPITYNDYSDNSPFPSVKENGYDYFLTTKRIQDYLDMYISKKEDRYNPYVAPLLSKDLKNQPKTLIITAQYDLLRDEGKAYGTRLIRSGNKVSTYMMKNALHGFLSLSQNSESVIRCYKIINRFLHDKNEKRN